MSRTDDQRLITTIVELLVATYGLHAIVHAIVDACYTRVRYGSPTWQPIAQALTAIEAELRDEPEPRRRGWRVRWWVALHWGFVIEGLLAILIFVLLYLVLRWR